MAKSEKLQPDLARRGVLSGAILTRNGREGLARQLRPLGPLPPWLNVSPGICGQCAQECETACPQGIIKIHPAGHQCSSLPYLDFTLSGCTWCGECADACPSNHRGAKKKKLGYLDVNGEKCLSLNGVFCMTCVGKCEYSALGLDHRRHLRYDTNNCIGCGMCVHVCPVDALQVKEVSSATV